MAVHLSKPERSTRRWKEAVGAQRALFQPWPRRVIFLALLVIPLLITGYLVHTRIRPLAQENGPFENFQAACLVLGMVAYTVTVFRSPEIGMRVLCGGLTLFYATIVLLEVDLRDMDKPLLNLILSGPVRDVGLLVAWLAAGWLFLRHRHPTWRVFTRWFYQPAGCLLLLSGAFWVAASMTDKAWLGPKNLFVEELLEVGAAFLMLLAAGETVVWNRGLLAQARL